MICPECHGDRKVSGVMHVNSGAGRAEWLRFQGVQCVECDGSGEISEARAEEILAGQTRRLDRIERGLSLREEARRLGMTALELSDLESATTLEKQKKRAARILEVMAGPIVGKKR